MKNIYAIVFLVFFTLLVKSQAATGSFSIGTRFPTQLFLVDALKNNTSFSPSSSEILDDVSIKSNGSFTIGTYNSTVSSVPLTASSGSTQKFVINSGISGKSGLRFTNLNYLSPVNTNAAYLGIDNNGVVVTYPAPGKASFIENETANTTATSFTVTGGNLFTAANTINSASFTVVPNSIKTLAVVTPTVSNIYFVNYTFSADITSATGGASYYECRLFIDDQPTTCAQTLREYNSAGNLQFALNYIIQLDTSVARKFDLRIVRVQNSGSETNLSSVSMTNLSLTYGVSILSFN